MESKELGLLPPTAASIIDQNTGKGSLIEGISEITVLRSHGTKPAGASIIIEDPPARDRRAWASDANAPSLRGSS